MKKEYNIKDKVWIHIGERKLVDGRVVEIVTLDHLNENHIPGKELYVIEIKTGIDDVYEVRSFDEISPDAAGPINLFRKTKTRMEQRYLKKVGIIIPNEDGVIAATDSQPNIEVDADLLEPTPEQIHAAMERAEQAKERTFSTDGRKNPRKRTFATKKKV
jgi:hypothetical protein